MTRSRLFAAIVSASLAFLLALPPLSSPMPPRAVKAAPSECRYFPETDTWLCHGFRSYWEEFGGLAIFGYPLTDAFVDPTTGRVTQWFERARFERHPGVFPERYDVLLGLLGRELAQVRETEPPFQPAQPMPGCVYFPETQHNLCGGFRAYWETFGGLAIFGYPISEEFVEVNPDTGETHVVQYFERQRFEWHPGKWPDRYDVLLGRLGAQLLQHVELPSYGSEDEEAFRAFVAEIDRALRRGAIAEFLSYVSFSPYTCTGKEDWTVPGCEHEAGRIVWCHMTAILNGSGQCHTAAAYAEIAQHFQFVHSTVYPPPPLLRECYSITQPLVVVQSTLNPSLVALVVARTGTSWHIVKTLGFFLSPVEPHSPGWWCFGIPGSLLQPWQP